MTADGPRGVNGIRLPELPGAGWVRGLLTPVSTVVGFGIGVIRGVGSALEALEALKALPRIARALERIAALEPTFREVAHLQGTVERIEQLGTFVATELPESMHQLEAVRGQLTIIGTRLGEINQAILNLTLTPRELDRVNTRLAETIAPLEDLAARLESTATHR